MFNDLKENKVIVVSAVNFFEGGPLSVLKDCLSYLNEFNYLNEHRIIALVHNVNLFDKNKFTNIEFIAFPKSRKSYIFRLYYEFVYFKKFAETNNASFWLSLHDITPRLQSIPQAVYCHNASPFSELSLKDIFVQPRHFFFRVFYKYIYKINIKRNKFIIVQQQWIKNKFHEMFNIENKKIIIAIPKMQKIPAKHLQYSGAGKPHVVFFFPTYPRSFKNIEVICNAVNILDDRKISNFEVLITIDGSENKYAESIFKRYGGSSNLKFIGLLSREKVYEKYEETDCLIFPSKLESWGLPISEFKQFDRPIFVVDLPYAKETIGDYKKAIFFNPADANELANHMENLITGKKINYEKTEPLIYLDPFAENWAELFSLLLN